MAASIPPRADAKSHKSAPTGASLRLLARPGALLAGPGAPAAPSRLACVRAVAVVACAALLAGCGSTSPAAVPDETVVATASGPVRGKAAEGIRVFQGIPYAAAPTGAMRWQPPVAPVPWRSVRDATGPGLRCIQDIRVDPDYGRPTSEDCLNLTVWTPDGAGPRTPRPVMVWIHGGGFLNGSADIYNSRWLATRGDIVVVTINYRARGAGLPGPPGADGPTRFGARSRQLRSGRPAGCTALGARQHRRVRRRPDQGDRRGGVCRGDVGLRPSRRTGVPGAFPGGHHAERAVPGPGDAAGGEADQR